MTLPRPFSLLRTFGLLGVVLCCGCSDRLRTYPVAGKVQFPTGSPVKVGTVELKSREHGVQARGEIAMDGTFKLTTYEPGDGAVEGTHDCVVVQFVMTEDVVGHRASRIGVIDRRYASYSSSGLTVEITPETEEIVIEVEGLMDEQPETHKH